MSHRTILPVALAALLVPAPGFTESLESASAASWTAFHAAGPMRVDFAVSALGLKEKALAEAAAGFQQALRDRTRVANAEDFRPAAPGAVADIDLAQLLNRHWKTSLAFPMGGVTAYVTGAFNRNQDAYVGVFTDGWQEPRFFNIKGLMDKPGSVQVGNATYGVTLSPNIFKPIKSEIVFENAANDNDVARPSVKRLLDGLAGAAHSVPLTDQTYKLFYTSELKDGANGPVSDPTAKTLVFLLMEGENFHVFLVPVELVPSDKIAVFKMHNNKRVGLQTVNGSLRVYENP